MLLSVIMASLVYIQICAFLHFTFLPLSSSTLQNRIPIRSSSSFSVKLYPDKLTRGFTFCFRFFYWTESQSVCVAWHASDWR